MKFKKLVLENIRSYERLEITFPTGSLLLSGDIGSGKTSILLGLQFALFGLQPGQKGSSILKNGKEEAYARLDFEIDSKEITVERTIKKAKNGSITQDKNILYIDSKKEELSTTEIKTKILQILNYPKEYARKSNLLYKYTVFTPQEEMKSIIQENPDARMDSIRHIFGMDRYKRIKTNAQVFLQKIKQAVRIKEVLVSELNLLKEKLNIETEKKIRLAKETNNLSIELKSWAEKKEQAEAELLQFQDMATERETVEKEIQRYSGLISGRRNMQDRLKKEIMLMQRQISGKKQFSEESLVNVKALLVKHKASLEESTSKLFDINSKVRLLEERKIESQNKSNKVSSLNECPLCFQGVSHEHKDKMKKRADFEIEDLNRELEELLILQGELTRKISREKELVLNYEEDRESLEKDKIQSYHLAEIETKLKSDAFVLDRTSNELKEMEEQMNYLEGKQIELTSSLTTYSQQKTNFNSLIDLLKKKEITHATKSKELEMIKHRLEELTLEIANKEKHQIHIQHLRGLQSWIENKFLNLINITERNVLVKLRGEFSKIFSEWFSLLVSSDLSVRIDENFSPIIVNQDYEIEYDFLSGGERTAIALAYRLGLNQVLNSIVSQIKTKGVMILDEPTDGFSSEQIDKMRDLFDELNSEQLILVSHEEKIEGFVDHIIRIKKDGESFIEEVKG
ncbi:SMC family ATPase [archaeon]|jgi:DNA repair protein SbcC/Rad50|nr:SMC family ATPase [archaeon]